MPSYDDRNFHPPAPVGLVGLRNPASGAVLSDIPLLIDTGADVTLLPRLAVERLGIPPLADEDCELMGFDGVRAVAPVVVLEMVFLGRIFRGRFLLIDGDHGVLGRNVLNQLSLLMDGPRSHWSDNASDSTT
jgi:predicted aspartyl protease